MQRVEENPCHRGCDEISKERISLKDVIPKVEVVLNIISENLVKEDVGAANAISLVKAKQALSIKSLYAFHVVSIDWSSVWFV